LNLRCTTSLFHTFWISSIMKLSKENALKLGCDCFSKVNKKPRRTRCFVLCYCNMTNIKHELNFILTVCRTRPFLFTRWSNLNIDYYRRTFLNSCVYYMGGNLNTLFVKALLFSPSNHSISLNGYRNVKLRLQEF